MLDITAYKNIKAIDAVFNQDGDPIDPQTRKPLDGDYYEPTPNPHYDRADGVDGQVYIYDDSFGFRAGSYGGYNNWREHLARLGGWPLSSYEQYGRKWDSNCASAWEAASGPFWELINFSDCEGTIGPRTAAKLAKDFAEYQEKADLDENEHFRSKFSDWRKAFEMAANNGAVSFH